MALRTLKIAWHTLNITWRHGAVNMPGIIFKLQYRYYLGIYPSKEERVILLSIYKLQNLHKIYV